MSGSDLFGWFAGALVTCSIVPQVFRVFKFRSAHEISMLFNVSLLIGVMLWLGYGIALSLMPVIIWNASGALLVTILLYAEVVYGRQ